MAHFFEIDAIPITLSPLHRIAPALHTIAPTEDIYIRINNKAPIERSEMSNRGSAMKLSERFSPAGEHNAPLCLQSGG
jgi:hypothetical protein